MAQFGRVGTMALLVGGIGLVWLMGYILLIDSDERDDLSPRSERIAVFLPGLEDWQDFRSGVRLCVDRGLARLVSDRPGEIVVQTPEHTRHIRFQWVDSVGISATREAVARLMEEDPTPPAFVGSSNTVLTAALADAIQSEVLSGQHRPPSPVLLVPWATSLDVSPPSSSSKPVLLLGLYPDRTFRFCLNNLALAENVVQCVASRTHSTPGRVLMVVDPDDPYSKDLAHGFSSAIRSLAPDVDLQIRQASLSAPSRTSSELPGQADVAQARAIAEWWRKQSGTLSDSRSSWIVLPLQGKPTRRLLRALDDQFRALAPETRGNVQVLCGDGIGLDSLEQLVSQVRMPVWCVSSGALPDSTSATVRPGESSMTAGVLLSAEIASTLIRALDQESNSPARNDLRSAIQALDLPANDPAAFGRSLAFSEDGERLGTDLGFVLAIKPEFSGPRAFRREADGTWSESIPIDRLARVHP